MVAIAHTFHRVEMTNEFRFKPGLFGKIIIEQKIIIRDYKGWPPRLDCDLGEPFQTHIKWDVCSYNDLVEQNLINVKFS